MFAELKIDKSRTVSVYSIAENCLAPRKLLLITAEWNINEGKYRPFYMNIYCEQRTLATVGKFMEFVENYNNKLKTN